MIHSNAARGMDDHRHRSVSPFLSAIYSHDLMLAHLMDTCHSLVTYCLIEYWENLLVIVVVFSLALCDGQKKACSLNVADIEVNRDV